jgi:TRAP-type transport system periplasmic protein
MKKTWLVILSFLAVLSFLLASCGGGTSSTSSSATSTSALTYTGPTIELRIAGGMPQGHAISVSILEWKSKLEAATNGKVKVTFYEAGTMGKSTELYDLVLNGTVEAAHMAEFWSGGRFPIIEGVDSLPFKFTGIPQQTQTIQALYDRGLLKELEPFKFLYFTSVGTVNIFTVKNRVNTASDLKGLKMRATGSNVKTIEALGGTALTVPGEEEYMDLQKGILDGNLTGADNVVGRKEYEVMKYGITNPISTGGFVFIMNKAFWDGLPKDIQAIIDNINKEEAAAHVNNQVKAVNDAWETLKSKMEIYSIQDNEMARWREAVASIPAAWLETIKGKGLPGDEIMKVVNEITGAK